MGKMRKNLTTQERVKAFLRVAIDFGRLVNCGWDEEEPEAIMQVINDLEAERDRLAAALREKEGLIALMDARLKTWPGPNRSTHFECWITGHHTSLSAALHPQQGPSAK